MGATAVALDLKKISAFAERMGPKKDYPTVIIGSGLGGLCCGAYLAKQVWYLCLFILSKTAPIS